MAEQSLQDDIAYRIRAELVCCDLYDRINVRKELTLDEAMTGTTSATGERHRRRPPKAAALVTRPSRTSAGAGVQGVHTIAPPTKSRAIRPRLSEWRGRNRRARDVQVRKQRGDARAASSYKTYADGTEAAFILLCAGNEEAHLGVSRVFSLHGARMADLERGVPAESEVVGSCAIRSDGFLMAIQGAGSGLLGLQMDATWGSTSLKWRRVAMSARCIWVGLLAAEEYESAFLLDGAVAAGGKPVIPPVRILKLDAAFE